MSPDETSRGARSWKISLARQSQGPKRQTQKTTKKRRASNEIYDWGFPARHRDTPPIAGWFVSWKIPSKMHDDWGYPYDSGNQHIDHILQKKHMGYEGGGITTGFSCP